MGFRNWLHGTWLFDSGVAPGLHGGTTPSHRVGTLPPVIQTRPLTRDDVRAIVREELAAEVRKARTSAGNSGARAA